jgi:hypothetical protein
MEMAWPLKIGVVETTGEPGWEALIDFREAFRDLSLEHRGAAFRSYLTKLTMDIQSMPESDPGRPGMAIVQQLVEQLLPHVESGDLDLHETIRVGIDRNSADALNNLNNTGIS